jgi:hypothetical protein
MPILENGTFLYLIGRPESLENGIWKLGFHTGSFATLRKRYITAIPDVIIASMYHHERAKEVERFLKTLLLPFRKRNEAGNLCEYFTIPFAAFDMIIRATIIIDENDPLSTQVKTTQLKTNKRKRQSIRHTKLAKCGALENETLCKPEQPLLSDDKFTIPVDEAAEYIGCDSPQTIIRIVAGRPGFKSKTAHTFVHGVDFVTNGQGNPQPSSKSRHDYFFRMTPACFTRVFSKLDNSETSVNVTRRSFKWVNAALREQMGESSWSRLQLNETSENQASRPS